MTLKLKKTLIFAILVFSTVLVRAEDKRFVFTEASDLTLVGKLIQDTPNPYHRVDTCRFKGFSRAENNQVRCSAGLAVLFQTNSSVISVKGEYGYCNMGVNTMGIALRGYDLYIKKEGKWVYASAKCPSDGNRSANTVLVRGMDQSMKECMLYLPMYSEMYSVKIGIEEGAEIQPLESPFRHRIGIFGSSFTQGISASRSGMSYPMQFMRNTGLQLLSLGCSGNSKLQPYFAEVLAAADVDAILFDSFSNPNAGLIQERLFPFIEIIQKSHPDIPLIFMQTIYREGRNFSESVDRYEKEKMAMSEKMMKEAMKKYKNVFFIYPDTGKEARESSVDGIHPSDMGYQAWARSIEKPVLKILKKYGLD